jgi:hypothetical protein
VEMEAEITEVTHDEYFHLHYTMQYRAGWRSSSGACGNGSCSHVQGGMSQLSLLQTHCSACSFIMNKLKAITRDKSELVIFLRSHDRAS